MQNMNHRFMIVRILFVIIHVDNHLSTYIFFNIPENESSLVRFEEILNSFSAAEEGKGISLRKREEK